MTAQSKPRDQLFFGSTVFRVAMALIGVFLAILIAVAALFLWQTNRALTQQYVEALATETQVLQREGDAGGFSALREAVVLRSRIEGGGLYLLEGSGGQRVAGNLQRFPPELSSVADGGVFTYTRAPRGESRLAVGISVPVTGGRLIVARDVQGHLNLARSLRFTALIGFGVLALSGLLAGVLISRLVLARVEAMRSASQRILAGDMSERLPVTGSRDELDDLARSLNAMISRISQLMEGLRDVSENIAHDLKTPLNRLRNRAEAALADPRGSRAHREGLERTIEAADEIIQTFNALLLIAKLEAGASQVTADMIDVAALVRDVCELYEPVAEEAGLSLVCEVGDVPTELRGNRQLVGQAVANLIDNAIKYSAPACVRDEVPFLETVGGALGSSASPAPNHRSSDPGCSPAKVVVALHAIPEGVEIQVSDRGPGIGEGDRERVLKRFVRLEKSRTAPGTGLGLSLVAAVARLHGGRIALHDNAPGLQVRLVLPGGAPSV